MTDAAAAAAPKGAGAQRHDHGVPVFDGRRSHLHARVRIRRLRAEALVARLRYGRHLAEARTLVQFAGWPRSGHSMIGALLDAHPRATIAHELDIMGLFAKGVPMPEIAALIASHARRFAAHGHWWNGLDYRVPDAPPAERPQVIGDKKGDWATRWSIAEPDLADRLAAATPLRQKWILVTRDPWDNVATMSRRKSSGRAYDRLRMEHDGAAYHAALEDAERAGIVGTSARDDMIEDWLGLDAGTAALAARVPAADWHHIVYEEFTLEPHRHLAALATFVGLEPHPAWLAAAAAIVRPSRARRGDALSWTGEQHARLKQAVAARPYLAAYRDA